MEAFYGKQIDVSGCTYIGVFVYAFLMCVLRKVRECVFVFLFLVDTFEFFFKQSHLSRENSGKMEGTFKIYTLQGIVCFKSCGVM